MLSQQRSPAQRTRNLWAEQAWLDVLLVSRNDSINSPRAIWIAQSTHLNAIGFYKILYLLSFLVGRKIKAFLKLWLQFQDAEIVIKRQQFHAN